MGQIVASSGEWEVSWPWPQVKFLKYYTVAFAKDAGALKLYELSVDSSSWNAQEIMTLASDAEDVTLVNVADWGPFYVLSVYGAAEDTLSCWIRNPGVAPGIEGAYSALPTINVPKFIACCNYNGQALIGGIETEDASWADLDYHSLAWCDIGTFNFRIQDGATAGHAPAPFGQSGEGRVWKILQLGERVIAYANVGIAVLTPFEAPTFGWSVGATHRIPIHSGECIDGNENRHGFIDENFDFWLVDSEGFKKLGFRAYLSDLFNSGAPVLVRYADHHNRFYISNGTTSYVVSSSGALYECHQCVTSIGYSRGRLCGFFYDTADYELRLGSNALDFRLRSIKTLQMLEVGLIATSNPKVMIKWRNDLGDFKETFWKTLSPQGVVSPVVSAVDFQIYMKLADYRGEEFSLDYLKAKLKLSDKRSTRGAYATGKDSA